MSARERPQTVKANEYEKKKNRVVLSRYTRLFFRSLSIFFLSYVLARILFNLRNERDARHNRPVYCVFSSANALDHFSHIIS